MLFLPKGLEAAEALSRLLQIGVALALWRACQILSLTSGSPFPLLHQGKATRYSGRAVGLENKWPKKKADYCWRPFPV